ncbi:hypothetical protein LINGRAHAP2_LOCUS16537 [Linum grandiflorum]
MGCSVSRFTIFSAFHSHPLLNPPPSLILRHHAAASSSNTTPHSHHSSPPPSGGNSHRRAMSIPSPLVHHPPSGNGDSDHLVFLTSTSYGSALHKSDQQQRCHHSPDSVPSPDSVQFRLGSFSSADKIFFPKSGFRREKCKTSLEAAVEAFLRGVISSEIGPNHRLQLPPRIVC